jgi:hypothetical protein
MTEQTKAQRFADHLMLCGYEDIAAELSRMDANEAELNGALKAAANYIDTLGGVSKQYRQLTSRIEAERNTT